MMPFIYIFVDILNRLDIATDFNINVEVIPHLRLDYKEPLIGYPAIHFVTLLSAHPLSFVYWIRVLSLLRGFTELARIMEVTFPIHHAWTVLI
jgi:hypothetical protein